MGIVQPTTTYPLNRQEFGIHSISAVNRDTGIPYGMAEIIGDASVAFEASSVDNRGGSSLNPWATEITEIDSNVSFNLRTFPDWVFELYMAATTATTAASASTGTVSALTNDVGTSVFDASTGVATATLKSGEAANMKTGFYVVRAVSATTVDVYTVSNFQFGRGTDLFFDDDTLKITTSALTIAQSAAVEIPGTGIELTGGSGVIALVTDDVAFFQVTPPHNGISTIDIGVNANIFAEHELHLFGKQRSSGESVHIKCYKAVCVSGMTYNMSQADFAATDITIKLLRDPAQDKVATIYFSDQVL